MNSQEFNSALKRLQDKKVRLTPQRKEILNYLITHHTHPTVEMIFHDLKKHDQQISMATVYNTVKLLVDYQLVIELQSNDESVHYDYFGHPHFHVICDNCGKITDVHSDQFPKICRQLGDLTRDQTGYLVTRYNVEIHGLCPECQSKLGLDAQVQ